MPRCIVGVPKEIKKQEGRVALTPYGAAALVSLGATVVVERDAGAGSGFSDKEYREAGTILASDPHPLWIISHIVLKVKEPLPLEYAGLRHPKLIFTYLHLAGGDPELLSQLVHAGNAAIAYEDVFEIVNGRRAYPLLAPMSRIAGVQAVRGALVWHREHGNADHTKLRAVLIGCGVAGEAALEQALAEELGCIVVFERSLERVSELKTKYGDEKNLFILPPSGFGIDMLQRADIVICAPMLPGGQEAPVVLTEKRHLQYAKEGCYFSDIAIDQGGSTEWTKNRPTMPGETFVAGSRNLVFSAVPNIPGSTVPEEATDALTKATFPYVEHLVRHMLADENGLEMAIKASPALCAGMQIWRGKLLNESVAKKFGRAYVTAEELFK